MNAQSSVDPVAPFSVEAEMQVLGAILCAADASEAESRVATAHQHGGADLFFDPVHAEVFKEISRRSSANMACDAPALSVWAREREYLADLGGAGYLAKLAISAVAVSSFPAYVEHLAGLATRRGLLSVVDRAREALLKDETDVAQAVGEIEAGIVAVGATGGRRKPVSMLGATHEAIRGLVAARAGEGGRAVRTGLPALDHLFGGFWPGELVILGGRPSMGKTALALSLGLQAARDGHGVAIFSLEMTPDQMAIRAISEATSQRGEAVCYEDIRRGEVNDRQMSAVTDAAREVADLPIQFLSREFADLGGLYSGAKGAQRALGGNMRLLIVDYLQLIRSTAKGRYEQMTEISMALKALAGRLEVPILALSQLSRGVESRDDKRPMLSDLRESGQIEQDADAVMFTYRDEYYLGREEPQDDMDKHEVWQRAMDRARNRLEVIVAKQRQGRVGTAQLRCNVALNRVWDERG